MGTAPGRDDKPSAGTHGAGSGKRTVPAMPAVAPPHAPETGWARRLLGRFHITGFIWYRFHGWGGRHWPSSAMWVAVTFFTSFFFPFLIKIRSAVAHNLEAVLGPSGWARGQVRAFKTFWTYAWCLSERYERLRSSRPFTVRAEGEERWTELMRSPAGFILVTAHLGSWEVGSMLPAGQREARRVHVVREAETDPRAQQYIAELMRQQPGGELYITHFAEDPQIGVLLLGALRAGEIVALQGDRPRAGGRAVTLTLFNRPFPLPVGPAALARAAGVPLVPVFVFREGRRRYRCDLRPPIQVQQTPDRGADVEEALRAFAGELERAIASEPHQWFCFRRIWTLD